MSRAEPGLLRLVTKIGLECLLAILLVPAMSRGQAKSEKIPAGTTQSPARPSRKGQPGARCDAVKEHEDSYHNGGAALSPDQGRAACKKENIHTRRDTLLTNIYLDDGRQLTWLAVYEDLGPSPMPVWSPDSSLFAFNYTGGGATCCWYIDVFDVRTKRHHSIGDLARRDNSRRLQCQFWNAYFDKWYDDTSVIVWLECWQPPADEFNRAYRIDVRSGSLLEAYGPQETLEIEKEGRNVKPGDPR